jgi:TetR/AcrR family transcriptional repressor of nem operon
MLSSRSTTVRRGNPLQSVVDTYLSPGHVAHPEQGCPLAALGSELARPGGAAQETLAAGVKDRLAWMRQLLPEDERGSVSEAQLIGALACMVGGVILARTGAEKDSNAVLRACREFVQRGLTGSAARPAAPRRTTRRRRSASTSRRRRPAR